MKRLTMVATAALLLAAPALHAQGAASPVGVSDLPILAMNVEKPRAFAVVFTGDGGWATIDRRIAERLNQDSVTVIGFDSRSYFRTRRTAEGLGQDVTRLLQHYLNVWPGLPAYLIGYSRGADLLPFALARMEPALTSRVALVGLLGPEREMDFEWSLSNLVGGHTGETSPTLPEVTRMQVMPIVCIHGREEKDTLCPDISGRAHVVPWDGGHHFDGHYEAIADTLMAHARGGR